MSAPVGRWSEHFAIVRKRMFTFRDDAGPYDQKDACGLHSVERASTQGFLAARDKRLKG